MTEWVGIAAGIFTSSSLLPQLIKLLKQKDAENISIFFLVILLIGVTLWVWYGVMKNDIPIIATNSFSIVINLLMIMYGIKYKKKS
ncbi:MAG TPA: SemiSWEET transporter [Chryseosolibacter sp.]